jgi:hypothetical protein
MHQEISPGALVRHPTREDWGLGQVQSAVGGHIGVSFEHAGKPLIKGDAASLVMVETAERLS